MSWEDSIENAEYVPAIVRPQMDSVVDRAIAAGAKPPLEYVGTGMTAVVLCSGKTAYKIARDAARDIFLADEAEWLETAKTVPWVKSYVARIKRFDQENDVIVRECPVSEESWGRYGESKLFDLHQEIGRKMIPYGWTAPEFKPDSYVITKDGPVLVDASMPSRVGARLLDYVRDIMDGRRTPRNEYERPSDMGFAIRMEVSNGTISQADADETLAQLSDLESSGNRWATTAHEMREARRTKNTPEADAVIAYAIAFGENRGLKPIFPRLVVGMMKEFPGWPVRNADGGPNIAHFPTEEGANAAIVVARRAFEKHFDRSWTSEMREDPPKRTWQQIEADVRRRNAKIAAFVAANDGRSFSAPTLPAHWPLDYHRKRPIPEFIVVHPDPHHEGGWRFSRFEGVGTHAQAVGHGERTTYAEAVKDAVRDYGLDLDKVTFEVRELGMMHDGPSFSPADRKKMAGDIARRQRDQARAEIAAARQEAADARAQCSAARRRAADTCALAKTLRTKRDALVALAHEYRLIRRAELARLGKKSAPRAPRQESDEEVRNNIPPELVPTWEVEKRGIKGNPRKSRTEAFLEWVEQHPTEIVYVEPSDEDYERSFAQRRASEMNEASEGKKYEYLATLRPITTFTVPKGFSEIRASKDPKKFPHGVVAYDKPLSRRDIESFELLPLDPNDPINLKKFQEAIVQEVMMELSSDKGYHAVPTNYGTASLTFSSRPGVEYQLTFFDKKMRPTGHEEFNDFREAALAIGVSDPVYDSIVKRTIPDA